VRFNVARVWTAPHWRTKPSAASYSTGPPPCDPEAPPSAIAVAAIGARLLRGAGVRSVVTREAVGWTTLQVHPRHIAGSAIFGTGWSIAATCPGPVTAMIGQGRLGGLLVATGIATGIVLHRLTVGRRATQPASVDRSAACV
jgi:uncharacterized membrane protein YedE/YeeE